MTSGERVSAGEFRQSIVFVTSYYDHPLAGLCRWKGELCRFEREYESDWYTVYKLTRRQKVRRLWGKFLFETCVGTHQTYRNGEKSGFYRMRRPRWFWRLMFKLYYMPTVKRLRQPRPSGKDKRPLGRKGIGQ